MSPSSSQSRFFENTEWSEVASSTPIPTNLRNSCSYSSRSMKSRSERIEYKACNSIAHSKRLRRDRRLPDRRIERGKLALQHRQRLVRNRPDRSRGWSRRTRDFQINVAEQLTRQIVFAAHAPSPSLVGANEPRSRVGGEHLFQQPTLMFAVKALDQAELLPAERPDAGIRRCPR